jgi:hypothetical protein
MYSAATVSSERIRMTEEGSGATPPESREVPDAIRQRGDTWFRQYVKWLTWHYILGIAAVLSSIIAGLVSTGDATLWGLPLSALFSAIAGLAAALITLLKPANRAGTAIRAWRVFDAAARRYSSNPQYPIEDVQAAIDQSEQILSSGDVD